MYARTHTHTQVQDFDPHSLRKVLPSAVRALHEEISKGGRCVCACGCVCGCGGVGVYECMSVFARVCVWYTAARASYTVTLSFTK